MADEFASPYDIAAALGVRLKRVNELAARLNISSQADGNLPLSAFAAALTKMSPEQQHQLRSVQRTDLAHVQLEQLGPFTPKPFIPATTEQAKAAEANPLTSPVRSRASWSELAWYWVVPAGEVQKLTQTLGLKLFKAQEGVEPMCSVVDLERKQAASNRFNQQIATAKKRNAQLQEKIRQREETMAAHRKQQLAERNLTSHIRRRVQVRARVRSDFQPQSAIFYAGPTNSGKTYSALEALSAAYESELASGTQLAPGSFVYAGPLRMLAFEVYQKLAAKHGAEAVGFLTGEEQINPQAPIIAATVEMTPDSGHLLVLDEAHWIADSERGQHWTDLLLKSTYRAYHVLCASEALETCQLLLEDAAVQEVRRFERKTPLRYKGFLSLDRVPDRSAVVSFSRKGVYAIANMLQSRGRKVGVLYGALPLAVRKEQIQRYIDGDYEVMVTTDVIGHGINLPIDAVVFAQSDKFDGVELRDLRTWEVAQIAGRAGRFGLSKEGSVFLLEGSDWFSQNEKLIELGTQAGAGKIRTDLRIHEALIAPTLSELGVQAAAEIPIALEEWSRQAREIFAERSIGPASMSEVSELFYALAEANALPTEPHAGQAPWPISLADLWQLISGPFNPKARTVQQLFRWLQEPERASSPLLSRYFASLLTPLSWRVEAVGVANQAQLEALEASVAAVRELKMAHVMFGSLGDLLLPELLEAEDQLNAAINNTLAETIEAGRYGHCRICNAEIAPWFNLCYSCNYEQQSGAA